MRESPNLLSSVIRSLILVSVLMALVGKSASALYLADHSRPFPSQSDPSHEALGAFLVALQRVVAADDRRKVASMIRYPIIAWDGGRDALFKTPASLLSSYDRIFSSRLKTTISEARPESLFVNWQGAMIHDGEVWFGESTPGVIKIIRINAPTNIAGVAGPSTAGAKPSAQVAKPSAPAFKVHPKVFRFIHGESVSGFPIATEINLDAVAEDHSQFDPGDIKQDGEWIRCDEKESRGFIRYRTIKNVGNRYTVEYQDNGGGTLTTSAAIEFTIEKRQLIKGGKPVFIQVLRVVEFHEL